MNDHDDTELGARVDAAFARLEDLLGQARAQERAAGERADAAERARCGDGDRAGAGNSAPARNPHNDDDKWRDDAADEAVHQAHLAAHATPGHTATQCPR